MTEKDDNAQGIWRSLSPRQKKIAVWAMGAGLFLIAGSYINYMNTHETEESRPPRKEDRRDIDMSPESLAKNFLAAKEREMKERDKRLAELEERLKKRDEAVVEKEEERVPDEPLSPDAASGFAGFPPAPPPPPPAGSTERIGFTGDVGGFGGSEPERLGVHSELVGGIAGVSVPVEAKEMDERKKKGRTIYLPPSFMAGTLLMGLSARTVESAKGYPMPVMIRIKDLAILPNSVKANLKGCFVIANAQGDLSAERVYMRLVTLACLSKKGEAVIEQSVTGVVADSDGKIGLAGRVWSKMGATLVRSLLAGFFEGAGSSIETSASTTSISALGTTQSIDPAQASRAGVGRGISKGAQELQKFYMELARQSMPVIEVGATKDVTIVVTEGAELEIRCIGEQAKCRD